MTTESTAPVIGALALPHTAIRSELIASRIRAAMWFLVPMIVALAVVAGWPLLRTIYFSFTNASLSHLDAAQFALVLRFTKRLAMHSGRGQDGLFTTSLSTGFPLRFLDKTITLEKHKRARGQEHQQNDRQGEHEARQHQVN